MTRASRAGDISILLTRRSGQVLAEAIREAYSDLFAINTKAQDLAIEDVRNKFKTLTQGQNSENVVALMAKTFKALVDLADWEAPAKPARKVERSGEVKNEGEQVCTLRSKRNRQSTSPEKAGQRHRT
jgi:hypothetical protein